MKTTFLLLPFSFFGCLTPEPASAVDARADSAVSAVDAPADATFVADASPDAPGIPSIAPGCGDSFIEIDFTLPSGERRQVCRSSAAGLGASYQDCRRVFVEGEFRGSLDPMAATWRVRERGGFNSRGVSMMQLVAASPLGRENCPTADPYCSKFGDCPVDVTVVGRVGDRVEAVLTSPCELRNPDDPGRVVIVHRARVVGRMTLESTGVQPHDGGVVGSGPGCDF